MRVCVWGTSGAGKTTFARALAARLGVPAVEMDAINWQAGWRNLYTEDPEEFRRRVAEAAAAPGWVMDGNYTGVRALVVEAADVVIWLDYSRAVVMGRVLRRSFLRAATGAELWPGTGNRETFARWLDPEHPIRWAWDTYERRRADHAALFDGLAGSGKRLFRARTPREAEAVLKTLTTRA